MKLRNTILMLVLMLLPFLVVSCFWQGPEGSIAFSVTSKALSRSLAGATTIRVYLMSGDALYPIQPAGYDEASVAAGSSTATYTSPPIPAGAYTMMIAVGNKDENGVLVTTDYADPVEVTVSPGVDTPMSVTLKPAPSFYRGLWGQNVTGVAAGNLGRLFVSTESKLLEVAEPIADPLGVPEKAIVDSGYRINSLSLGFVSYLASPYPTPWVNTNKGIVPYNVHTSPEQLEYSFATGAGVVDVLESAWLSFLADPVVVYQRNAGLGGAVAPLGVPGTWYDVDLSEFLSGRPFLDVAPGPNMDFVYFATSLGAFRLPSSVFDLSHTAEEMLDLAAFFKVTDTGGAEIPILSLAVLGSNKLAMGTEDGLYIADLAEASPTNPIGQPTLVAGTEGKAITSMATVAYRDGGAKTLVAMLADTGVLLYRVESEALTWFPFYSGLPADLPGDINGIALQDTGWGFVYLTVVGKKGLVILEAAPSQGGA